MILENTENECLGVLEVIQGVPVGVFGGTECLVTMTVIGQSPVSAVPSLMQGSVNYQLSFAGTLLSFGTLTVGSKTMTNWKLVHLNICI